jgi:cytoskeleton protein RodZ
MSTPEKTLGFGTFLRNHRRGMGMPIEVVSQKTKIRITILRQIENEDLGNLPSPTFVKGFVRAYAEAVGADVQEVLQRFDAGCMAHARSDAAHTAQRPGPRFWLGFLLACLVLILLVAITLFIARRFENPSVAKPMPGTDSVATSPTGGPPGRASTKAQPAAAPKFAPGERSASTAPAPGKTGVAKAVEGTVQEMPNEPVPVISEPQGTQGATPASAEKSSFAGAEPGGATATPVSMPPAPHAKLVLQITAMELTWLKVTRDGRDSKEMTLKPDDRMTLEAENRFELHLGNAGGIQLTLNGQPVRIPARRGKVVKLTLP